jgi:hypothetical protein
MSLVLLNKGKQMSETALAQLNSGMTSRHEDDVFNSLTIQGGFLPRVGLYSSSNKLVKKALFPVNHYGIVTGKDTVKDIGLTFNAIPIAVRPLALDLRGKKAIAYYNPASDKFKELQELSGDKDSKCMAGVQFLLYIQNFGLATFFCASKSAKLLAPSIRKLTNQFVVFGSQTIEANGFVWQSPTCVLSNVQFELPMEEILKARTEFLEIDTPQEQDKDPDGEETPATVAQPEGVTRPR